MGHDALDERLMRAEQTCFGAAAEASVASLRLESGLGTGRAAALGLPRHRIDTTGSLRSTKLRVCAVHRAHLTVLVDITTNTLVTTLILERLPDE